MIAKSKRKLRTYKIKSGPYLKAKKRAKEDGNALASLIETWVTSYSAGYNIISEVPINNKSI